MGRRKGILGLIHVIIQVKILQSPDMGAGVSVGDKYLGICLQISQLKREAGTPKGRSCE